MLLFTDSRFKTFSTDAKLFYGILIYCMELSRAEQVIPPTEQRKKVKDTRYIIVIQSGVWYNFSIVDSDKLEFEWR